MGSQLPGPEVVEQIGERKAFHEFVLSGNEESLEEYYKSERRSQILGGEAFVERVNQPAATLAGVSALRAASGAGRSGAGNATNN